MTATNRLINAKRSLVNGNTSATKLIDELESQIKSINRTQNEGAKIRSRAKFFEEGEKPTRFFFSLESTRAAKNSIRSLYDLNGTEVNTQQEIEHALWNFYSKLYSAEQIVNLASNISKTALGIIMCESRIPSRIFCALEKYN